MKLWLLRPTKWVDADSDTPWRYGYDVAIGFVIRAETEEEARKMIGEREVGFETEKEWAEDGNTVISMDNPWWDPKRSMCVELTADGTPGVIIRDFNAG